MTTRFATVVLITAMAAALPTRAQEQQPAAPPETKPAAARRIPPPMPLKVTVTLSRYQGEKRVSSMPYSLGVTASGYGPAPKTTLRMGVDVPITQTVFSGTATDGKPAPPVSSYNYRSVGTNIDCGATYDEANAGIFQLTMTVSDSSIGLDASKKTSATGVAPDIPSFRNFNSSFTALLRDGQTTQYTSATDPVTGELMKIDVTVNVMK
jgi:hypothetical protein